MPSWQMTANQTSTAHNSDRFNGFIYIFTRNWMNSEKTKHHMLKLFYNNEFFKYIHLLQISNQMECC